MSLYEYMVMYEIRNSAGKGRICITRTNKIESYSDVEGLDEYIKKHKGLDVIVTDFKLLRTYKRC